MMMRIVVAMALTLMGAGSDVGAGFSRPDQGQATPTPRRVISLIPAVTEMLFAMGAGDRVIGVSSFDTFPAEVATRAKVGGLFDPDFERILTLKPDLVIVYGTQSDLIQRLGRVGIPMFHYQHAGLADITKTVRDLGARLGIGQRSQQLATEIERDLDAIRARVKGRPQPKTMLVFGREADALRGVYASGGIGFLHDMLETAGGANVFADLKRQSIQVSMELLLTRAPDVVIELLSPAEWTPARNASARTLWKTVSIPAARNDRVYVLVDNSLTIPGPRVAASTRALSEVLHATVWRGATPSRPPQRAHSRGPLGPAPFARARFDTLRSLTSFANGDRVVTPGVTTAISR